MIKRAMEKSSVVSLENIDQLQQQWAERGNPAAPQPVLNSPRSLEACRRASVNPAVDLAKPSVVDILREISNGASWPLSIDGLTPQKAAILDQIPLAGRHFGSFDEKRAAVEKYQHLEARRATTVRMLQEIRQQLVAAEEFAARKANPSYKKMPASLPPTSSPKQRVPQLPLRRVPHRSGSRGADEDDDLVSLSTATASEAPRSSAAFLAARRQRAASPTSSSGDDSSDQGVELIHITSTGREDCEFLSQQSHRQIEQAPIYDRTEALKDRGLHRTIKTPSNRGRGASDSPPRRIPPTSPPRPALDASTHDLVERVLEREAASRAANEIVASRSRETSPLPRPLNQGGQAGGDASASSSPGRFETNKSHRRQLIDQAIAFRALQQAQQPFPKITSPTRAEVVSPTSKETYNYRSSQARISSLGPSLYA